MLRAAVGFAARGVYISSMMLPLLICFAAASAANETSFAYYESPSMVTVPQGLRFSTILLMLSRISLSFFFFFQRAIFFKTGTPHTKRRRAKRRSRARRGRGRAGRQVHSPDGRGGDLGSREGGRVPKTVTQSVVFREEARPCRAVSHGTMTGARQRNSGGRMRLVGAAGRGCLREQLK